MPRKQRGNGYSLDTPVIGRAALSRRPYIDTCPPVFDIQQGSGLVSKLSRTIPEERIDRYLTNSKTEKSRLLKQKGGMCFQQIAKMMIPMGKNQLVAMIFLLISGLIVKGTRKAKSSMDIKSIRQKGGNKLLMPMNKNMLIVIATLLFLHYLTHSNTRKKLTQQGGNQFVKELIKIMDRKGKQKGGQTLADLAGLINPLRNIVVSANRLIRAIGEVVNKVTPEKKPNNQTGGYNLIPIIQKIVMPLGVNTFLSTLGLTILTMVPLRRQKGGQVSPNDSSFRDQGSLYDVIAQPTLTYTKNLSQFGCTIPEWGYILADKCGQSKCV